MNYNNTLITTLENKLRVAHLPCSSEVAYIGLGINVGSSDERPEEYGMSHFIEHMLFKGTTHKSNYKVISTLENVGGELNAYTSKEETFIYAALPKAYLARAIELIADVVFNSTFPEAEMEKEKDVVIDEINSYKDNPSDVIYDEFEELVFQNHPLGHNILGSEKLVKSFTQDMIFSFIKRNYTSRKMLLFVMADVEEEKVIKLAKTYFSSDKYTNDNEAQRQPLNYVVREKTMREETYQAHTMLGNVAYPINDKRRTALHLLCNLLGGPAMNARINYQLRERNGIGYNIEVHYASYVNTGIVYIYFGSDEKNVKKGKRIIYNELQKIVDKPLSESTLKRVKQQYLGQLLVASESNENCFLTFGKRVLLHSKYRSLEEIKEIVEAITTEELYAIAKEVFKPEEMSALYLV